MADPVVPLDIEEYLEAKVLEQDPTFELREGSAFRDFFIKPLVLILQPIRDEIEIIRSLQSLVNFATMSTADLDALIANIFLSRRTGSLATGVVRLFFAAPQNSTTSAGSAFISADGLRFLADEDTTITSSVMSVNVDGASFFFDVPVTAEAPGVSYNIAAGSIVSSEIQVSGSIRVTNVDQFLGGLATETNTEFFNRAQTAVTVRNIVNDRSIITTLLDQFGFLKSVEPIGFNDPEMERAKLTVVLPGPPQHTVTIPDRGGRADVYIEGDGFESRSVTVQSAPQNVGTNSDRGLVAIVDFGFRRISVERGYFSGILYPGNAVVDLLPNLRYTASLKLTPGGNEYELDLITTAVTNPYLAVPSGQVPIANLETSGSAVIDILDIRVDVFEFDRPVITLDSAELLDPVSLQPTGVVLRDGETAIVPPSVAVDPGSLPNMALSRGSGDIHFVFKRDDGVYYQRHDSQANIVQAAVQISSDVNATNLRVSATLQENLNVFFLDFPGNLRHVQIDNVGAVTVAESTISGVGATLEFTVHTDQAGFANLATINDNAGQPDLYFIRVDEAGAVSTVQVLMQSTAGNASEPCVASSFVAVPDPLNNTGTAGITVGADTLQDLSKDFTALGVVPTDLFVLYSGTGLPLAEQGVYTVLSISTTTNPNDTVTFSGAPVITAATLVDYDIIRLGGLCAVWLDDISGNKNVRTFKFTTNGIPNGPPSGEHVVLSDPTDGLENTLPECAFQTSQLGGPGWTTLWVNNGTEIQAIGAGGLTSAVVSSTGDTQGTLLSRSFFDASNPFAPTDAGKYLSLTAGTGLTDTDFRLYEIEEFISAGHVLLAEPVTDSTAADIEFSIVTVTRVRRQLAPTFFLNQITALESVVDNSNNLHVGVVETEGNSAKVFLGKFDVLYRPLLRPVFVRVSASANNRGFLSIHVDELRQPYLSWGDFSASEFTVQLAKFQAQEYAYFVNDSGISFSVKEDASIILDPTLVTQAIRFNYTHSARVPTVEDFVVDTVNRIVIGNYLTRHTLPAFVDVTISYGGQDAPTTEDALTLLTDFINAIGSIVSPPSIQEVVTRSTIGNTLEFSDLADVLYDNGADSVRIGNEMLVDETQTNGTVRTQRSIDRITITRTARFEARTITLTRE